LNLQAELGDRYTHDPVLQRLGTIEALREYLAEEAKEMQRQGVDPETVGPIDKNPNNILAFYLARRAPAPTEMYHAWDEGDYPDIDCVSYDTPIKTARGDIEMRDIRVGDIVCDANDKAQTVLAVRSRKLRLGERVFKLIWDDNSVTVASENHVLVIDGEEVTVEGILSKTPSPNRSGKRYLLSIFLHNVEKDTMFYDIEVTGNHLFQLANGAISHNCDFSTARRSEVRTYLERRFGSDRVLAVATYGGSGVRGALQDLGRVYNVNREELLRVTTALEDMTKQDLEGGDEEESDISKTFGWMKEHVPGAKELLAKFPVLERWTPVYGLIYRYVGRHAAAIVVCNEALKDIIPLIHAPSKKSVVSPPLIALREGSGVKELQPQGFMKLDILALSNVDVLHDAERFAEQRNPKIRFNETTWHSLGYDWPEAYKLARDGDLDGIFQLEGPAGRRTTKIVQPESFEEIVFISAAMRPGAAAAKAAETFYMAKQGQWPEGYPDYRDLKHYQIDEKFIKFMAETRGVLSYQEQLMQFLCHVGDVPMPFTNKVRKVVTIPPDKRKPEHAKIIEKAHNQYMTGAMKRGMTPELAERWWDTVVGQAGYSFNKCLATDSLVLTVERGEVPILDVRLGEMIWSYDEETKEWFKNEVVDIHYNGVQPVYESIFYGKKRLRCTMNHRLLTNNGPVMVGTLPERKESYKDDFPLGITESGPDAPPENRYMISYKFSAFEPTVSLEMKGISSNRGHNYVANGFINLNSHCVAYSIITFRELFMKARFKVEFYAALLKHADSKKFSHFVMSARRAGVVIEPPDVNRSMADVTITPEGTVLLGFNVLKRVGKLAIQDVIERRPYSSFQEFLEKHTASKKSKKVEEEEIVEDNDPLEPDESSEIEVFEDQTEDDEPEEPKVKRKNNCYKPSILSLLYANAFRSFEPNRAKLLCDFFDFRNSRVSSKQREALPPVDQLTLLKNERDCVNFVFSDHELCQIPPNTALTPLENAPMLPEQSDHLFFGLITAITKRKSERGRPFWIVTVTNFRHEQRFYCWKMVVDELKSQIIDRREVRPAAKVGDGLIFWARRTERNFWNMTKARTLIPSLQEYYERNSSVLTREPDMVLR